ncbi:MAG TPA: 2-oxoglutarate and iron-dependent oxygenase domain-containing protein [Gammaproteobacteria bacterium]|nr:2-oxoglutarate and iron-dependent oxygenase domain-containing protein [Gammaproteobacteria bacterium]
MDLDIIPYPQLVSADSSQLHAQLESALLKKGIVGISQVPGFEQKRKNYLDAARRFAALPQHSKNQYAPDRDSGKTEGYELGAEWFQTQDGQWRKDDKKASFYAFVPDRAENIWPKEMDLRTSYLDLGQLIFQTGKALLSIIGLDKRIQLDHDHLIGYGRMLHYYKEADSSSLNNNWCGAHFDHGVFTGLIAPAYFRDGIEIEEPQEAGLYIVPTGEITFTGVKADPSILLFQVGEFGQLISNDQIRATQHCVKKAGAGIERFTFALFYIFPAENSYRTISQSKLTHDERYARQKDAEGGLTYQQWADASYERYRAR